MSFKKYVDKFSDIKIRNIPTRTQLRVAHYEYFIYYIHPHNRRKTEMRLLLLKII